LVPDPLPALLTTKEVAAYRRVTPRTVRNWEKAGLLTPIRFGRTVRFRREDIVSEEHMEMVQEK
jgi:excisionase family DNA binding protein